MSTDSTPMSNVDKGESIGEDENLRDTFNIAQHSADQESQNDQPLEFPESTVADATATGKY